MKWQLIEMNATERDRWEFCIPYLWRTRELGRAEFSVCIRWRRGAISDLWVAPRQQGPETSKLYHITVTSGATGASIANGVVWMLTECREHQGQNFLISVPDDTDLLQIKVRSSVTFVFTTERVVRAIR